MLGSAREGVLEEIKEKLDQNTIPVDFQNEQGGTALHFAAANGHAACVKELLGRGARVIPNGQSLKPFFFFCFASDPTFLCKDLFSGSSSVKYKF